MRISVPREVKDHEFRVALTPSGVNELVRRGHQVGVEAGAGKGSMIPDEEFASAGATILQGAQAAWEFGDLVVKVKEPQEQEFPLMRPDQVLFTYLHLAAEPEVTRALMDSRITSVAYETVQLPDGMLPLLYPMSEVAGCLASQVGAYHLTLHQGGRGVLMGGIGGVDNAKVVVLGAGVAGMNAANIALGMGADVTVLDTNLDKLRGAFWRWDGRVRQLMSNALTIEQELLDADLVIGSVLIPGARAPKLVSNDLVSRMKSGAVLVDIAIDQGGCMEGSSPSSHADPTYRVHDTIFYSVTNMPSLVPSTATQALTNATFPYVLTMAEQGWRGAMTSDAALALGLSTHAGQLTNTLVGEALGLDSITPQEALAG